MCLDILGNLKYEKGKWNVTERMKNSESARGTQSLVSCFGVTATELPSSHQRGNVPLVNNRRYYQGLPSVLTYIHRV